MMVYIDNEFINELCDVPQISTEAFMFFHVFKRLNQMPNLQNNFEAWATYATLAGLEMPPPIGTLCRSGPQFRAFTNPVIFYEAGIGTSKLASDSVPFRKVLHNSQRQQKVFQNHFLWCIICFLFSCFSKDRWWLDLDEVFIIEFSRLLSHAFLASPSVTASTVIPTVHQLRQYKRLSCWTI